ncbi:hypothetical protein K466DRAFT_597830 [Polyporus arcularius HHB13444]|uniref:F-box domain-containing protein n=1 Tax=Polyporus arcularius HHB13444 TaxID=1314778 RepID=A0A5C3PHV6_9APHY|nr:hypothetical protein K466DRAFT_597830 [Polyporus arcularius HHB13444]
MQTCKTLYHEGIQLALTETIQLHSHDIISSFSSFVLHTNSAFLPYLRNRLSIWIDESDPPHPDYDFRCFPQAMLRTTHLRSLHIMNLEPLLRAYPDLSAALLSLPALEDLVIEVLIITRHAHIAKFLRGFRCPLKSIRLQSFVDDHGKNVGYRREADPLWLFAGVANTLEIFSIAGLVHIGIMHCFRNVKKFHTVVRSIPILRPFIASFPALRTLVAVPPSHPSCYAEVDRFLIDWTDKGHWAPRDENFPTWIRFREENRRDQLANGSWDTLDTLISNSLVARTFGLTCYVRRVHLLLQFDPVSSRVIMTVANVLRDTEPHCLRLAFYRLDIEIVLDMMEHLIYVRDCLSALELRLNICEGSFDAKQYLDQLADALRHSMITSLRVEMVCFRGEFHTVRTECRERFSLSNYCIMEETIRTADVRRLAEHFIATVPNLRHIQIMWGNCYMPYGLDGGGVEINIDVGPEVYDIPAEDHPDDWDATW